MFFSIQQTRCCAQQMVTLLDLYNCTQLMKKKQKTTEYVFGKLCHHFVHKVEVPRSSAHCVNYLFHEICTAIRQQK